MQSIRYNVES